MVDFHHLLEPGRIGEVSLRNRLVMAPMTTGYPYPDGRVSERTRAYYRARAAGGVGLIIVEACLVHPSGKSFDHQIAIYDDSFIHGLHHLTDEVHGEGAKIFLQLHHGGMMSSPDLSGQVPWAPSPVALPGRTPPRPLTRGEIADLVEAFGQAARRAREAGFDGVELHGAHGYLINQFLSPFTNRRSDDYGGTPEQRLRFALECLQRCRELAGADYTITIRLSADEFHPHGLDLSQAQPIAQALEAAGVDAIHVSAGAAWSEPARDPRIPLTTGTREGVFLHLARGIKNVVQVPIIAVGQIYSPEIGEMALERGDADFVALGRALLAEPAFANKLATGRREQVIPCVNCDFCQIWPGRPGAFCTINAETGREFQLRLEPAQSCREVLVLGGSLPGLEVARVAALRGHRVAVWCPEQDLGGLTGQRAKAPGQEVLARAVDWYAAQLKALEVTVKTAHPLEPEAVEASGAQVVAVATAGQPKLSFPASGSEAFSALDVISGKSSPQGLILAAGSGVLLAEAALSLAMNGNDVILVETGKRVAHDSHPRLSARLRLALEKTGTQVFLGTKVIEIAGGRAVLENEEGRYEVSFDSLLYADAFDTADWMAQELRQRGLRTYLVGDAFEAYELGPLMGAATQLARQL